jgi:hypothetical protein
MSKHTATIRNAAGEIVAEYDVSHDWRAMCVSTIPADVIQALARATFGHTVVASFVPAGRPVVTEQTDELVFTQRGVFGLTPGHLEAPNHMVFTGREADVMFTWVGVSDYR